jgi:acyl CoA:acetate/3-ketoacid CoA transferase alpha subunit
VTIAEVEEIVEIGEIPPDHVHVPSIYVQKVIKGKLITVFTRSVAIFVVDP